MFRYSLHKALPRSPLGRAALAAILALAINSCTPAPLKERENGPVLRSSLVYHQEAAWHGPLARLDGRTLQETTAQDTALWHLQSSEPRFGGWSDLVVLPDGSLQAISDRGYWWGASLADITTPERTPPLTMAALRGTDGNPMTANERRDSEGLIVLPNGGLIVSFERVHRLWYYPPAEGQQRSAVQNPARALNAPETLGDSPYNGGAEALTLLPDGRILMIAEGEDGARSTQGWVGTPSGPWPPQTAPDQALPKIEWQRFRLARDGLMRPTAATALKDSQGRVFIVLLERAFGLTFGFRSQISLLPLTEIDRASQRDGAETVSATPVLDLSRPPLNDNWEAIFAVASPPEAVKAPDPVGATLWLMSDDNYRGAQRSLLLRIAGSAILPSQGR